MTEDEARKKWCPMVRTGLTAGMAVNHHVGSSHDSPQAGDVHDETRCIASDCMMWRQYKTAGCGPDDHASGYCGLAGHD